jgi:hypothetical protein
MFSNFSRLEFVDLTGEARGILLFCVLVFALLPIAAHSQQIFSLQAYVWMVAAQKKCATQRSPVC